ncbi:MAG: DNA-directed RNA polymerases I, II, and III subunit RPABC3 [Geoglossum umbratile]|nr:MAG: DNA-directed RNA polymerases I, II, and III subunit RPABC3 [Geoglossum umbratile]
MSADAQLFDDTFNITAIDANKYDRVSRLSGISTGNDIVMTCDVNTELYPCSIGDTIQLVLASTLSLDGSKDDGKGWRISNDGETSLSDIFDYVCHGKIYRFEEGEGESIKVYISFGGLLLFMQGPYKKLTPLRMDYVYLLMKK